MKTLRPRTPLLRSSRLLGCLFLMLLLATSSLAWACPFCSAPSLTLTEQLASAQTAALVQWSGGKTPRREEGDFGTTEYEVLQVVHDESGKLQPKSTITLDRFRSGKPGDLFLLLGNTVEDRVEWSSPLEVTETSFNYMVQAPSKETDNVERLAYFLKFLEFSDPLVAEDAYGEFANSSYDDVVKLSGQMSAEKLKQWLTDPNTVPTRIGLYGMMLGLCGTEQDAAFLKDTILEETEDFRLGIEGVMGGYLLLTGNEGLKIIQETKLANTQIPFSETFAAMQSLRFMWTYGQGRIAPDDLRAAMRVLLDRPNLADLVIVDLARWKDWTVMDRLMSLYDREEYKVPSIKRAIVRYMIIAEKDVEPEVSVDAANSPSDHCERAAQNLAKLREMDPKTVQAAERYFFD